jgi:hypothetical protein
MDLKEIGHRGVRLKSSGLGECLMAGSCGLGVEGCVLLKPEISSRVQ